MFTYVANIDEMRFVILAWTLRGARRKLMRHLDENFSIGFENIHIYRVPRSVIEIY